MSNDIPRHWKPLTKLNNSETFTPLAVVLECMSHYQITEEAARKMLEEEKQKTMRFLNHLYQVEVRWCGSDHEILHLNIRRRDGAAIFDWRHIQQIKNEIAGPEAEGYQIFPRESRKVDTSNKYHLFIPKPENLQALAYVGWHERDVQYNENRDTPGLRQRTL